MVNHIYWINTISSRLDRFGWVEQGKVAACRCPICGDSHKNSSKKRFYFFEKSGKFRVYCHNCSYSATLYGFLKKMYPDVARQYILESFKEKSIPPNAEDSSHQMKITGSTPWDFTGCIPIHRLPKDHFVTQYVINRKIPFENVLYSPNVNDIVDRCDRIKNPVPSLLIPYRRKNEPTEVFQIRFFDPKIKPKYLTFKYKEDSLKVWNLDFVDMKRRVYVTEGPIDAMMLDNSIAVGGSNLSIARKYVVHPVLIYDNEPRSSIICDKIYSAIQDNFEVVIFPSNIKEKDLNDMVRSGIDVKKIVNDNIYTGLNAELVFKSWRKC